MSFLMPLILSAFLNHTALANELYGVETKICNQQNTKCLMIKGATSFNSQLRDIMVFPSAELQLFESSKLTKQLQQALVTLDFANQLITARSTAGEKTQDLQLDFKNLNMTLF